MATAICFINNVPKYFIVSGIEYRHFTINGHDTHTDITTSWN